jgi:hypothetical protein
MIDWKSVTFWGASQGFGFAEIPKDVVRDVSEIGEVARRRVGVLVSATDAVDGSSTGT